MKTKITDLTGFYSKPITLRFGLKPTSDTHIEKLKELVDVDDKCSEDAEVVKDCINDYHKANIDRVLSEMALPMELLESYTALYMKAELSDAEVEEMDEVRKKLRTAIHKSFTSQPNYNDMFGKSLVESILPSFVGDDREKLDCIMTFSKNATYFQDFNDIRKRLYTDEEKAGSISFRIVHDNLPKFVENIKAFKRLSESGIKSSIDEMERDYASHLGGARLSDVFFTQLLQPFIVAK